MGGVLGIQVSHENKIKPLRFGGRFRRWSVTGSGPHGNKFMRLLRDFSERSAFSLMEFFWLVLSEDAEH